MIFIAIIILISTESHGVERPLFGKPQKSESTSFTSKCQVRQPGLFTSLRHETFGCRTNQIIKFTAALKQSGSDKICPSPQHTELQFF